MYSRQCAMIPMIRCASMAAGIISSSIPLMGRQGVSNMSQSVLCRHATGARKELKVTYMPLKTKFP